MNVPSWQHRTNLLKYFLIGTDPISPKVYQIISQYKKLEEAVSGSYFVKVFLNVLCRHLTIAFSALLVWHCRASSALAPSISNTRSYSRSRQQRNSCEEGFGCIHSRKQ